jgi:hypothetical protein
MISGMTTFATISPGSTATPSSSSVTTSFIPDPACLRSDLIWRRSASDCYGAICGYPYTWFDVGVRSAQRNAVYVNTDIPNYLNCAPTNSESDRPECPASYTFASASDFIYTIVLSTSSAATRRYIYCCPSLTWTDWKFQIEATVTVEIDVPEVTGTNKEKHTIGTDVCIMRAVSSSLTLTVLQVSNPPSYGAPATTPIATQQTTVNVDPRRDILVAEARVVEYSCPTSGNPCSIITTTATSPPITSSTYVNDNGLQGFGEAVYGLIGGGVAAVILISVCCWWCCHRHPESKSRLRTSLPQQTAPTEQHTLTQDDCNPPPPPYSPRAEELPTRNS